MKPETIFSVPIPDPNLILVAWGLGVLWVMLQAGLEEMDLLEQLPAINKYRQQVPRFLPKVRLQ